VAYEALATRSHPILTVRVLSAGEGVSDYLIHKCERSPSMKQAFLLSEQGVANIYFFRDANPRIQWLIDLGIPNFTTFSLVLPIPGENPHHTEIIFHEGLAVLLEQIKAFMVQAEFGDDGGVINSIVRSIKNIQIDFYNTEPMLAYEILFPLSNQFYHNVMNRLVRQKVASKEMDIAAAVWKGPRIGERYVGAHEGQMMRDLEAKKIKKKDQQAFEDAKKMIDRYKQTLYKNTPGPMYVMLYDRFGKPRGVNRVTNKGLSKWAKTKFADEFAKVPKQVLDVVQDIKEIEPQDRRKGLNYVYDSQFKADERLQLLRERTGQPLNILGKGSSRVVVALTDKVCLKLALNTAGVAQNKSEYRAYEAVEDCSLITRIFYYDPDFEWLICERVLRPATDLDFKQYIDAYVGGGYGYMDAFMDSALDSILDPLDSPAVKDPIAVRSLQFLVSKGMDPQDIQNPERQWGVVERKGQQYPVILDYGLTDAVWNQHYSSKIAAGWKAYWITEDGEELEVTGGKEHWEVAEEVLTSQFGYDYEEDPAEATNEALRRGWIRVSWESNTIYLEVLKWTREEFRLAQDFVMQLGGIEQVIMEEEGRCASLTLDEFLTIGNPNLVWRMSRGQ